MYREFRKEVASVLRSTLEEENLPTSDLGIEDPPDDVDAVLASSIAFRLAGVREMPPPDVAAELADMIELDATEYISEVTTAGPYLNFHSSDRYYTDTLKEALSAAYGQLPATDTGIVVEHTSANPTGPVHVGRARNPIIGDALSRILSLAGHDVERHYYVNDAGRQVAVFTWAYETIEEDALPSPDRDKPDYKLVRYYRAGNQYLDEADETEREAAETDIQAIMQGLEAGDEATYERVATVVDQVLSGMQESLARLPVEFDRFIKETRFLQDGSTSRLVERLKELDEAVYEDDAWQLDLAEAGIEKHLVFLRSDGTTLYPTRDLAHHEWKLQEFDEAVTVLGEDHKLQAAQIRATLDLLGNDVERLAAIHYGWVNLPGGEGMSTRQGTGIDLDELIDEAIERARHEVEIRLDTRNRDDDLTRSDIDRIARQVGLGAVRYDIVSKQPTKAITFEWERALDFEAQSAPYLQYVHARCCGILGETEASLPDHPDAELLTHAAEIHLLEVIARFPRVVEEAAEDLAPHYVATYCRNLAEAFNTFYRECPVITAENPSVRRSRLALVQGAKHTMANALNSLGIEAPESM